MKYVPIGPREVSGKFVRLMSTKEYESVLETSTLGAGRSDYVPTFSITDIAILGNYGQIRERAKKIGVDKPDVLTIFSVSNGEAVYGPRQRIGGREIKIKAGTPVELLNKIKCR